MKKLFEHYIEEDDIHIKYARGKPSRRDTEFHDYNEFVYFIEGKSHFISKNVQQELSCGSVIIIPQENYHQFIVREPDSYLRCIIGFRSTSELGGIISEVIDSIKVIFPPDKCIVDIFSGVAEIMTSDLSNRDKLIFARASLMQLLIRIKQYTPKLVEQGMGISPLVSNALDIIDTRFGERLTVKSISALLYISPSTLSHRFKNELNISVYQYITKKRLSVAHYLINQGEPMTSASIKCGFSDYSCFYRLYKKYYGNI